VLGNEEEGLRPATLKACDEIVTIPGSGAVESLNVAASAAILIYAMARDAIEYAAGRGGPHRRFGLQ
jgi:TrmH RNA methyltransferase